MGVGERQQHPLHAQLFGPDRCQPAEPHIGPAIGRADDFDLAPADSPGRLASLQRLVGRFLGGESYGHVGRWVRATLAVGALGRRSEEHTSELQSLAYLVCRLLLEKKKK